MHLILYFAGFLLVSNFGLSVSELVCAAENEHYAETVSACPRTCANPHGPICMAIIRRESCVCNEGTVNDTVNHRCVAPESCPQTSLVEEAEELVCAESEVLAQSHSACPTTCQNRHILVRCLAIIVGPSCECMSGTIRDTVSGKCVAPDACPA